MSEIKNDVGPSEDSASAEQPFTRENAHHGSIELWDDLSVFDETRNTHLWIVIRGTRLAAGVTRWGAQFSKLFNPVSGELHEAFHDQLCHGLFDADAKRKYNDDGTFASHFYDPMTGWNWERAPFPTALTRASQYFAKARDQYVAGSIKEAGYHLGLSLHYFTDLSQPMHAGNYTFFSSFPFGFHTAVETVAMEIQEQTRLPLQPAMDPDVRPEVHTLRLAQESLKRLPPLVEIGSTDWRWGDLKDWRGKVAPLLLKDLALGVASTAGFVAGWMRATQERYVCVGAISPNDVELAHLAVSFSDDGQHWTPGVSLWPDKVFGNEPVIATFKGRLHCVYRAEVDQHTQLFHTTSPTGASGTWTAPVQLPYWSGAGAALCVFGNALYLVYRGYHDQSLWWAVTEDGETWIDRGTIGELGSHQSLLEPSLAVLNDELYCFHRGRKAEGVDDIRLWFTSFDGTGWAPDTLAKSERGKEYRMIGAPSATFWLDRLAVFFNEQDEHRSTVVMSRDGVEWVSNIPEAPERGHMIAVGGKVILTGTRMPDYPHNYVGAWSRVSYDLRTFTPRSAIFGATDRVIGAPSIAVLVPA